MQLYKLLAADNLEIPADLDRRVVLENLDFLRGKPLERHRQELPALSALSIFDGRSKGLPTHKAVVYANRQVGQLSIKQFPSHDDHEFLLQWHDGGAITIHRVVEAWPKTGGVRKEQSAHPAVAHAVTLNNREREQSSKQGRPLSPHFISGSMLPGAPPSPPEKMVPAPPSPLMQAPPMAPPSARTHIASLLETPVPTPTLPAAPPQPARDIPPLSSTHSTARLEKIPGTLGYTEASPEHPGKNQDMIFARDFSGGSIMVRMVADGMGGEGELGDIASQAAVRVVGKELNPLFEKGTLPLPKLLAPFAQILLNANQAVKAEVPDGGTAATIVLIQIQENGDREMLIAQAADTRAYFFTPRQGLTHLTIDNLSRDFLLRPGANRQEMKRIHNSTGHEVGVMIPSNPWPAFCQDRLTLMRQIDNITLQKELDRDQGLNARFRLRSGVANNMGIEDPKHPDPFIPILFYRTLALREHPLLIIMSDGIFDNLTLAEMEEILRENPDMRAAQATLIRRVRERYRDKPHVRQKEDDLSLILTQL